MCIRDRSSCLRHYVGDILTYIERFSDALFIFRRSFPPFLLKCAPRPHRRHNFEDRPKASLKENLPFSTSKRPKLSLFWSCYSALSLCSSILSPFIRSMPPKLDLKNLRKYVYYCYRWLPWTDLNHVSDIILMTSSCMRHYVGDILTYPT